jgi:type IV secretory pathway TraG/TraD family ATPase VirD4
MENKPTWYKRLKKVGLPLGIFICVFSISFFALNLIVNLFFVLKRSYVDEGTLLKPSAIQFNSDFLWTFSHFLSLGALTLILVTMNFIFTAFFTYKIRTNYGQVGNGDEKGTGRFTTIEELKKQYRAIPEKIERFEGGGGIPISRLNDKILIDDSPVNNLIIGTTRSGKGEVFVVSAIDIYSRAKNQASLIVTDPKGELYAASKEQLESLNYNVQCLNLMNPFQSISYNLLELVKNEFLMNNFATAQQYARSVAFMIYNDPLAKDKFWQNASTDLVTALILGLCEYSKNEPYKITMYNIALMMIDLATQTVIDEETGVEKTALDKFFEQFEPSHPARMQYATIDFAKGQTRAAVLSNTTSKLGVFTLDGTAKLTSKNTFDMRKFGFNHWLTAQVKPLARVNVVFNGVTETIRSGADGVFTIYHKNHLKIDDEIAIQVEDEKASFKVIDISNDGNIQFEQTSGLSTITISEWMQDERPVALFMIIPDYDQTFNILASLFIKQVYTLLARIASNVKGNKCHREVIFKLDEFGNLPVIEGIANILTVCLGRNIRFNLIIQAYSQIESLYGNDWKTIDGNCNNTIYLLTSDLDTAERISKTLGPKTIKSKSQSGKTIDFDKSKTIGIEARSLLDANELMRLKEGESVVIRTIKRQDINRNRIRQFPIYNHEKTAMKYRWEYLGDLYDTSKSINDFDIPCAHADMNLKDIQIRYSVFETDKEESNEEITMKQASIEVAAAVTSNIVSEVEDNSISFSNAVSVPVQINNGLNQLLFKVAFKRPGRFEEIFGDAFETYSIGEVRDLIIAYKDEMREENYIMLNNMLTKQMNEGEN